MKYIRTKDGIYEAVKEQENCFIISLKNIEGDCYDVPVVNKNEVIKQADTIEELIQIGDIVFYWQQSDDKEHCSLMVYDSDIHTMKYNAIIKLLIPVREDYKCVAKGFPSFNLIRGRRFLINKGELELL